MSERRTACVSHDGGSVESLPKRKKIQSQKMLENAPTATSRLHYPDALSGRCVGQAGSQDSKFLCTLIVNKID